MKPQRRKPRVDPDVERAKRRFAAMEGNMTKLCDACENRHPCDDICGACRDKIEMELRI